MHRIALALVTLIMLTACSSSNQPAKEAKSVKPAPPPARVTTFNGYANAGFSMAVRGAMRPVLVFLDPDASFAESETPATLFASLAGNAADLQDGLKMATTLIPLNIQSIQNKPVSGMTFIMVYQVEAAPSTKWARATPGKLTRLSQVVDAHGPERERQAWNGKPYRDLEMEGVVYWWGEYGVKASPEGAITHLLHRGKPKPQT